MFVLKKTLSYGGSLSSINISGLQVFLGFFWKTLSLRNG
jgi:hypothetical protein